MNPGEMRRFVQDQMKMGEDSSRILQQLVDRGVEKREAMQIVEEVSNQMLQSPIYGQPFTPQASLALPVLGGLLAAFVGGGLWTLVFIATEDPMPIAAWGVGAICGFAVLWFARGQRGTPLQVIAVITSLIGILIGKYGTFYYIYQRVLSQEYGEEASLLSPAAISAFVEHIGDMFGGYSILWVVLAVATAWGIPKVASQTSGEQTEQQ